MKIAKMVSRVMAVVLAAGMTLTGLPVYAANPTATTVTSQTAPVGTSISTVDRAIAQQILTAYLTQQISWDNYIVGGSATMAAAPNPMFAIADLDGDGQYELFTNSGADANWDIYFLRGTQTPDWTALASGYSAEMDAYIEDFGTGYDVWINIETVPVILVEVYDYNVAKGTAQLITIDGSMGTVTLADAQQTQALFTNVVNLLQTQIQPLNAATIQALAQ